MGRDVKQTVSASGTLEHGLAGLGARQHEQIGAAAGRCSRLQPERLDLRGLGPGAGKRLESHVTEAAAGRTLTSVTSRPAVCSILRVRLRGYRRRRGRVEVGVAEDEKPMC